MAQTLNLSALFVDTRRGFAQALRQLLWPEIQLETEDSVAALNTAFQHHVEQVYGLCFIAQGMNDGADSFFKDVATLGRRKTCTFVQVFDTLPADTARIQPKGSPFDVVISRAMDNEDKKALLAVLGREFRTKEVERRSVDVAEAVDLLLRQIDQAAIDVKRGGKANYHRILQGIINLHTQFDHDLLERYYDKLIERSAESEPVRRKLRDVPDAIVKKQLPKLSRDGYKGASSRVFSMLVHRFGEMLEDTQKGIPPAGAAPQEMSEAEEFAADSNVTQDEANSACDGDLEADTTDGGGAK